MIRDLVWILIYEHIWEFILEKNPMRVYTQDASKDFRSQAIYQRMKKRIKS